MNHDAHQLSVSKQMGGPYDAQQLSVFWQMGGLYDAQHEVFF